MIDLLAAAARPALLALDPETAHRMTVEALKRVPLGKGEADDPRLAVEAFGLKFANPVGMAAGFDKNAEVPDALIRLGFGFAEVGTLTPKPQEGNPKPRLFRLYRDEALVNRLGFNNRGHADARARLAGRRRAGIVGVNIGANKDAADRVADYVAGVETFAPLADYLTINVSSPNTPGLRDLQAASALDELLARAVEARDRVAVAGRRTPVLLKIAPDLALGDLDDACRVALARGIDGLIVSNTTITRPATLKDTARAKEAGGLSGGPLFALSTRMLAETYLRVDRKVPLVGVGGIDSARAAYDKIRAGATLVQLYSALVFRGLGLVGEIKRGLPRLAARDGFATIGAAVGTAAKDFAS